MARTVGAKDRTKRKTPAPVAEWRRCTARSKQTGEQCKRPATFGTWTCRWHGSEIPQVVEATQKRLGAAVPLAVARLVDALEYGDDRLACAVAKDLLDRLGLAAPIQLQAQVEVTTPEVESLLAGLRQVEATRRPTKAEQIIASLATQMGLPADLDDATRLEAVYDAVVGHEAEVLPDWPRRQSGSSQVASDAEVTDAEIVEPVPAALPPARPAEPETIVVGGQRYPTEALSPVGVRRRPDPAARVRI
jgi:hypothetical protein